ncbi:hypothetical protein L2E82_30080 [Cichorium intybus]|uniref:Uncharacterized protein n=1 Tax=Cichorium intybus TaxID=13427 RepID=A0ACB9CZE1_CICIN|nr:hypothetical protein L2E82_30080 [Cichorium intybus]
MASTLRDDATQKSSDGNIFISWKETVGNEPGGDRRIEFFLQLENFLWILAVIGVETSDHRMEYVIDPTFYSQYKKDLKSLGKGEWKRRCDVVVWLKAQMSGGPFSESNYNMLSDESEHIYQVVAAGDFSMLIDSEATLAFPSGYKEAYSIPPSVQMVLKHGARNFYVMVEDGRLTQGWNYFVREHEIKCGYSVKFQFCGCSTYEIEIFDWKKGKKVYPWSNLEYHEWI